MYKLINILKEVREDIKFTEPNFEMEWGEAKRYPDLFPDKETWLKAVKFGQVQDINCSMDIQNTDMCDGDLSDLDPAKAARAMQALDRGEIELPIVLKVNGEYELLGGNTRATALAVNGLPIKAWVIDMSLLSEAKQVGTLYHFTSYPNMISIIDKNFILKSTIQPYVSFTRNKSMVSDTISQSVRITVDGDKLSNRYQIMPHADLTAGYGRKGGSKPGQRMTGDESEERVSLEKYPKGVDIFDCLEIVEVKKMTNAFNFDDPEGDDFTEPPSLEAYQKLIFKLKDESIPYRIVERF